MGFISNSKMFNVETTKWYCNMCHKRRPIEVNSKWDKDGRPHRWAENVSYEWFVRCAYCKNTHYTSEYDCPNCGRPVDEESGPIEISNYTTDIMASYEYGITGHSWTEKHKCKTCRRIFWISNGDW